MSALSIGTSAVEVTAAVGRARLVLQNLGPGIVYLDFDEAVTTATGIELPAGAAFEFSTPSGDGGLFAIATATSDVRCLAIL